jgi:Flp pilus assembly protein TadG
MTMRLRLPARLTRFLRSVDGTAAVEFAFVVPILLTLYLGSMEVSQALDTDKRVSRTASMVADLVTQQEAVSKAALVSITQIGDATLAPYARSLPTTTIVAIQVSSSATPQATAVWSIRRQGTTVTKPVAAGAVVTLPVDLMTPGAFIVKVTTQLDYVPVTTWSVKGTASGNTFVLPMGDTYYLRPRLTNTISCSDC